MAPAMLRASLLAAVAPAFAVPPGFVSTDGPHFVLDGQRFQYGGTNAYYLHYSEPDMVNDTLARAKANGFHVLRMFPWMDSVTCDPSKSSLTFQCWDAASGSVFINSTALVHLDFALAAAKEAGIRIVMPLTNNWGNDEYVQWRMKQDPAFVPHHDDFYSDPTIRDWYKTWAAALISRVNTYNGVTYRDDPTIFAWQLMNEPRCSNSGPYKASDSCVNGKNSKLTTWVAEMSAHIKSLDPNHMVSVGDEGFYCRSPEQGCPAGTWYCDCSTGVDSEAFLAIPTIDYGTAHMYPESWVSGADALSWGSEWIANHTRDAHSGAGKPFVLEEFGIVNKTEGRQHVVYDAWTQTMLDVGTNGFQFWMIAGLVHGLQSWYPNYDRLNIYCPHEGDPALPEDSDPATCSLLAQRAAAMAAAPGLTQPTITV